MEGIIEYATPWNQTELAHRGQMKASTRPAVEMQSHGHVKRYYVFGQRKQSLGDDHAVLGPVARIGTGPHERFHIPAAKMNAITTEHEDGIADIGPDHVDKGRPVRHIAHWKSQIQVGCAEVGDRGVRVKMLLRRLTRIDRLAIWPCKKIRRCGASLFTDPEVKEVLLLERIPEYEVLRVESPVDRHLADLAPVDRVAAIRTV